MAFIDDQFYTKLTDVWAQAEQLWEGVFSLIAAILIFIMGIAFLKMDRSRVKWRFKLAKAFEQVRPNKESDEGQTGHVSSADEAEAKRQGKSGKWALFLLPFVTVLREGLEAVVFVGGVSGSLGSCPQAYG
jgi:high-affinity iron transporter